MLRAVGTEVHIKDHVKEKKIVRCIVIFFSMILDVLKLYLIRWQLPNIQWI